MITTDSNTTAIATLTSSGIRPSAQRIAILRYLMEHRTHPTVDEIFRALHPIYPTLSRTTVYNTLHLLVEGGTTMCLDIESGNARYDYAPEGPHAHFLCTGCHKIIDIFSSPVPHPSLLEGYKIDSTYIYYKGVCPDCLNKTND